MDTKSKNTKRYGAIVIYPGFRNFFSVARKEIRKLLANRGFPTRHVYVEDRLFSKKLKVHVALFALPKPQTPLYQEEKGACEGKLDNHSQTPSY